MKELFGVQTIKDYEAVKNVYPQVDFKREDNKESFEIAKSLFHSAVNELVTFNFRLNKPSPLTDVLSQSFIASDGLLISNRFSNLLDTWILNNIGSVNATVRSYDRKEYQYYWIYPLIDVLELINYQKTKFKMVKRATQDIISEFKVNNYKDMYRRVMKITYDKEVRPVEALYFNESWCVETDVLITQVIGERFFVTKELKALIEKENITGISISEDSIVVDM